MPGANIRGDILFCACGVAIVLIKQECGIESGGLVTIIIGSLLAFTDVLYRLCWVKCDLLDFDNGALVVFLPAWVMGVFWIFLGAVYAIVELMRGPA